jgi:xanthine/CO dehydrogenase XdhC/CoxF family maturation factor
VAADTTPEALAAAVVSEYYAATTGHPRTISALDLGQAGAVEDAVSALATALQANLDAYKYYVSSTRSATQKFDSRDYYAINNDDEYLDLYDLARLLKQNVPD